MASKIIQTAFDSGKYSARMDGRVDVDGYRNACKRIDNWLVFPQGGAIARSGSKYIANTKSDGAARLIPFVISTVSAYIIEVGNGYMRFYKTGAQLVDSGSPVEIVSPYLTADLFELDFAQTNDVMYFAHTDHAPRKLSRISDTEWILHEVNFDTEPLIDDFFTIDDDITIERVSTTAYEKDKTTKFTDGTNTNFKFLDGDIGRVLFAGQRSAKILWAASSTTSQDAFAKIINQFLDDDATLSAGELSMVGTPFGSLNPSAAGAVGDIISLTSNVNGTVATSLTSATRWIASSIVPDAYYWNVDPTTEPTEGLAWHGDFLNKVNNPASIAGLGQWAYGDADSLGFNTIYIRTPLDTNPNTLFTTQNKNAILRVDEGSKGKDISAQDSIPQGIAFSTDGSKMYMVGATTTTVYQYTLSTPWDVSTASYASKSKDVSAEDTDPFDVTFSVDGTKMYIMGLTNQSVFQYTLSTPWDVSTASYASKSKDVSAEDTVPLGVAFKTDGASMYVAGDTNDTVFQYTLGTPWDVNTAAFAAKSKDVSAQTQAPYDLYFKTDGASMYVVDRGANDTVFQYTLGTPWDLATAAFAAKSKDVSGELSQPWVVVFNDDGAKMYVMSSAGIVFQYVLGTPWDVSTAAFITGSSANLFRKGDEGKFIQINGGLVQITTFIDNTSVQGRVLQALSAATATTIWVLGTSYWSSADYPGAVVFHENRLVFGGSPSFPNTFWGSAVADFDNFQPGTGDGDSYAFTLNARKSSLIRWLESRDVMIAGLEDAEWQVGLRNAIITPSSIFVRRQTIHGSANIQSVVAEKSILFVERGGDKLRELNFDFESDSYIADDKTLLAEDVGGTSGFKQIDVQNRPFPVIWGVNNNGDLVGMTYIKNQGLAAWHVHKTGATAAGVSDASDNYESVAVIPNLTDETVDEVWVVVNRTINGSPVRFVEQFEKPLEKDAVPTDARMLDAFTLQETTATTVSGLDRFDGDVVTAIRDGDPDKISTHTVAAGSITITAPVTNVVVGLPYKPLIQTMRPAVEGPTGTAQAQIARISKVWLRLFNTLGLKCGATEVGVTALNLEKSSQVNENDYYTFANNGFFEGDVEFQDYAGGSNRQNFVFIVQDLPLPATVTALVMEVDPT